MSNKVLTLYIVAIIIIIASATWSSIAFYTYKCEAFSSGLLSMGYAPARCIAQENK